MNKVLIPGSFDPITIGHLDLIKRSSKMFDLVYVGVMNNENKKYLFTPKERVKLIEKTVKNLKNVKVVYSDGLTVDLCEKLDCKMIVKGVRTNADYEYELNQANINFVLRNKIETVLLLSKPEFSGISSSTLKMIWNYGGNIDFFLPKIIKKDVMKKLILNKNGQ